MQYKPHISRMINSEVIENVISNNDILNVIFLKVLDSAGPNHRQESSFFGRIQFRGMNMSEVSGVMNTITWFRKPV